MDRGQDERPWKETLGCTNRTAAISQHDAGQFVSFVSSCDLVGGNADGNFEIFQWDRLTDVFTMVTASVAQANDTASSSFDGGFVAFVSDADYAGANGDGNLEVFRWNRAAGTIGQLTDTGGFTLHLTADIGDSGNFVAFERFELLAGLGEVGFLDVAMAEETSIATGDPVLPAMAGGVATPRVAYASRGNLSGGNGDGNREIWTGAARRQHFASCPRPADSGLDEACTVFQWSDWGFIGRADVLAFQAVLYHTSFAAVFQVGAGDSQAGADVTRGIQDAGRGVGLEHRGALPAETALCFFEPRFPVDGPAADLVVEMTDGTDTAIPDTELTYTILVRHEDGPSPVTGATVSDVFPGALTSCTWTCTADLGASCSAAGSGPVDDEIVMPVDSTVTYLATCQVAPDAAGTVTNTVTVALPASFAEIDAATNTATDVDTVASAQIFADDLESGDVLAWSRVIQ